MAIPAAASSRVGRAARAVAFWICLAGLAAGALLSLPPGARAAAAVAPDTPDLDVVLIIDQSGSMWERNDPRLLARDGSVKNPGWRIAAANLLAEWLATDQSGARHQLSVIMFGTGARVVFPLQDIQSEQSLAAFQAALAENHRNLGATNIPDALRLAKGELNAGRPAPAARKAVILLSDGVCEPKPETSAQERQVCEQDIRELIQRDFGQAGDLPIYTIALTAEAFRQSRANSLYKNLWQEIAFTTQGDYYEPAQAEQELLASVVSILQRLFELPIQDMPPPSDVPAELTVELPAHLEQVVFTAVKYDPGIGMTVTRPDGTPVEPGVPGTRHAKSSLTESYGVSQPHDGLWTVKLSGRGKAVLIAVPYAGFRPAIDHARPGAVHPQGKPMRVEVRVIGAGQAAQAPDEFEAVVALPDGTNIPLALEASGGRYTGVLEDTSQLGTYLLRYSGRVGERAFSDQHSVQVLAAPWLQVIASQAGRNELSRPEVQVQAQVMLGELPMERLDPEDRVEVIARLTALDGRTVDTQFLRPAANGLYSGTLLAAGDGDYIVRALLSYAPASGERFEDSAEAAVRAGSGAFSGHETAPAAGAADTTSFARTPADPAIGAQDALLYQLNPIYLAIAGIAAILLISLLLLAGAVGGIKRATYQSLAQQDRALRDQRARDVGFQLESGYGWQVIASQIVADALRVNIAIDGDAGILHAAADPSPRFTIVTHDWREVIFTTDVSFLRKAKLVKRGDRVIDVSALSQSSHTDAGMLWRYVVATRNLVYVTPPASAHWHIVIRSKGAEAAGGRALKGGSAGRAAYGLAGGKTAAAYRLEAPRSGRV